jgi:hypothetical protein
VSLWCAKVLSSWLTIYLRYHTDPSGTFMKYDAKAIGSGSEAAQSELQDKWHKVRSSCLSRKPYLSYSLEPLANDTPRSTNTNSPCAETSHGGEARSSQRPTSAGSSPFPSVSSSSAKLSMVFVGCTADRLQDT